MSESNELNSKNSKLVYLLRQILISTGAWSTFFIIGLNTGAPTVLIPQLRTEANSTDAVTEGQASWLAAAYSYSGIPWVVILPILAAYFGRKITVFFVCCCTVIGYIIFYTSFDVQQIIIGYIFHGVIGAYTPLAISTVSEYTSSEYRGLFLTLKSATFYWGILTSNTIGTFCHWKFIPMLGLLCTMYNILTVFFWPESPIWLIKKRRFDQGAESHRWLKGSCEKSEKELYKLIADNQNVKKKLSFKEKIRKILQKIVKKEFYKPMLLCAFLSAISAFSGKLVCMVYAIEVLKKITNSSSKAYAGMLILDAVTVIAMYIGCGIARVVKRRFLLFSTTSVAVVMLFLLSLYLYLVKLAIMSENTYISMTLLIGYSIAISCGPMILASSISGELIPIDCRTVAICSLGLILSVIFGTFLKVAPLFFRYFGMHGTFFFFGLSSAILVIILYYYLPETKDKTIQEITDNIKGKNPIEETRELLPTLRKNNVKIVPATERTFE